MCMINTIIKLKIPCSNLATIYGFKLTSLFWQMDIICRCTEKPDQPTTNANRHSETIVLFNDEIAFAPPDNSNIPCNVANTYSLILK